VSQTLPGMLPIRQTIVVLAGMSGFFVGSVACAQEEAEHHAYPHHHAALFAGVGNEHDANGHEEHGAAIGLEYEMQFSDYWGAGVDVEYLSGSDTHRSWVVVVPVSYHLTEKWRLFAGPGLELGDDENKYLARFGIAYEIPFLERWTASPEFLVDFIEGGANTVVLGISVGYGF